MISGFVGQTIGGTKSLSKSSVDNPAEGESVYLLSKENNVWKTIKTTTTDETGYFEFTNLPIGTYQVIIEIPGLNNITPRTIEITEDGTEIDDIELTITEDGIYTNNPVSITAIEHDIMYIYPNPATEILYFNTETAFEIIDIHGRVVLRSKKAVKSVNINNLQVGTYFVKIGNSVQKFVKE
jgi:serine-aspartate repeat-containing protein C/D/E